MPKKRGRSDTRLGLMKMNLTPTLTPTRTRTKKSKRRVGLISGAASVIQPNHTTITILNNITCAGSKFS